MVISCTAPHSLWLSFLFAFPSCLQTPAVASCRYTGTVRACCSMKSHQTVGEGFLSIYDIKTIIYKYSIIRISMIQHPNNILKYVFLFQTKDYNSTCFLFPTYFLPPLSSLILLIIHNICDISAGAIIMVIGRKNNIFLLDYIIFPSVARGPRWVLSNPLTRLKTHFFTENLVRTGNRVTDISY